MKNIQIFGFPWCSTREDLSIDVSITNVGVSRTDIDEAKVISALCHKLKFEFLNFLKKIQIFGFPWCIQEARVILGYRQTDGFGILIWKHVGTQKISTQNSKLVVSCRFLCASPEDEDA